MKQFFAVFILITAIVCIVLAIFSKIQIINQAPKEMRNSLLDFFKLNDGIDLRFAHAVNSQAKLEAALKDSSIMVLEADVLVDPARNIPIMAHPPDLSSDLTLRMFLAKTFSSEPIKGIKLDFKQIEAVQPSLEILKEFKETAKLKKKELVPILLNADILPGPNKPKKLPVNATKFIELCSLYSSTEIISPGWTTTTVSASVAEGYSWNMAKEMQAVLQSVRQAVTSPVRASLVAKSKDQLIWLLESRDNYSLTLWHGKNDDYNISELAFLRKYPAKVYYDLPVEKISDLRDMTAVS